MWINPINQYFTCKIDFSENKSYSLESFFQSILYINQKRLSFYDFEALS